MKHPIVFCCCVLLNIRLAAAQANTTDNPSFIRYLYRDTAYVNLKKRVSGEFAHAVPGHWGEFVKGVDEDLVTTRKIIALTFDACGGPHGSGYDQELIAYLRMEKIAATLFVTGKWIDANYATFAQLANDPLFEIENHGFNHQPCSVDGESEYGIRGTADVPDAFDEIQANALKIQRITGRKPKFYRSATAYIDEACAKMARQLGVTCVSFDVLSGDAVTWHTHARNRQKCAGTHQARCAGNHALQPAGVEHGRGAAHYRARTAQARLYVFHAGKLPLTRPEQVAALLRCD